MAVIDPNPAALSHEFALVGLDPITNFVFQRKTTILQKQ